MEIFLNDCSLHEQFSDIPSFRAAIVRLMGVRKAAGRFGREIHCHRTFAERKPIRNTPLPKALNRLTRDQERAVMSWIARGGPFWDDRRQHDGGDWLERRGEVVTDSAVGEAAYRKLHGAECGLVSVAPSDWECSPIDVVWRRSDEGLDDRAVRVLNWWNADALETFLQKAAPPIRSWRELRRVSIDRFAALVFSDDCFEPLYSTPFAVGAANRFLELLAILDRLARCHDKRGVRTEEGHQIYRTHFTGDRARFSDSSDTEKRDFENKMTFRHPRDLGSSLFCTWHGKLSSGNLPLRLHFSWPVPAGDPVYVVYAGLKITRR